MLSADQSMHFRKVDDFIQMLGDIGGLYGLVISILQTIMAPLIEHAFNIKAIQKLYMAKSSKSIFKKSKKNWRKKYDPVIENSLSLEEKLNYFST